MPSMCAASTASASSPAARASSQAARKHVRPRPALSAVFATRPRSSRMRSTAAGIVRAQHLPRRRRASRRRRRTAAGAPGRARAASGSPRERHRRARPGLAGQAPRTGARSRPGRRSPRDGRARRAGRSWDHDPRRPPRASDTAYSGSSTSAAADRMPAARPRRRGATRTRRVSRRSRRRACRPSRPARSARTTSADAAVRLGDGAHAGHRLGELVGDVEPGDAVDDAHERVVGLVAEVERVGHDPDVGRAGLVEQRERIGERGHEARRRRAGRGGSARSPAARPPRGPRRPRAGGRRRRSRAPSASSARRAGR